MNKSYFAHIGIWLISILFVFISLNFIIIYAILATERGTDFAWKCTTKLLNGRLSGQNLGGSLLKGVSLRNVTWYDNEIEIKIDHIEGTWQFSCAPWKLVVQSLRIRNIDLLLSSSSINKNSYKVPKFLRFPLQLDLHELNIIRMQLSDVADVTTFKNIQLSARSDGLHHHIFLKKIQTPLGNGNASFWINGISPFPLTGHLVFHSFQEEKNIVLQTRIDGTLKRLFLNFDIKSGSDVKGHGYTELTPFNAMPFAMMLIEGNHINPREIVPSAPEADLKIHIRLIPEKTDASIPYNEVGISIAKEKNRIKKTKIEFKRNFNPIKENFFSVQMFFQNLFKHKKTISRREQSISKISNFSSQEFEKGSKLKKSKIVGEIEIINSWPGRFDENRLLFLSAKAQLHLDAHQKTIKKFSIRFPENAMIVGSASMIDGVQKAEMIAKNLDLHQLHPILRHTHFSGPILVKSGTKDRIVQIKLDDVSLHLCMYGMMEFQSNKAIIKEFRFSSDTGYANITASLGYTTDSICNLKAALKNFNLYDFFSVVKKQPIKSLHRKLSKEMHGIFSQINGNIEAIGSLATLDGNLSFNIRKSTWNGFPMIAIGKVNIVNKHLLPSMTNISIGGNSLFFHGSLGSENDNLYFSVTARALENLGVGVCGTLISIGRIQGTFRNPKIIIKFRGKDLIFIENRIAYANGKLTLQDSPDGIFNATLKTRNIRMFDSNLSRLDALVIGTRFHHTIEISMLGRFSIYPINLKMKATGSFLEETGSIIGWSGKVSRFSNQGNLEILLNTPVRISIYEKEIAIGKTCIMFTGGSIFLDSFVYRAGILISKGHMRDANLKGIFKKNDLLSIRKYYINSNTDLIVDADWDFQLGGYHKGFFEIRNRSGDIKFSDISGNRNLGLRKLFARLDLYKENFASVQIDIKTSRIGNFQIRTMIKLNDQKGKNFGISSSSMISGTIDAHLPSLRAIGELLEPDYLFDGEMYLHMRISNQIRNPYINGELHGKNLGISSIEYGLQVKRGTLNLVFNENCVSLQRLEFYGGEGMLYGFGKIQLDRHNPQVDIKFISRKMEFFNTPDRKASLSGQAIASNNRSGMGINIKGNFFFDHALLDLPKTATLHLGDDVLIVSSDDYSESNSEDSSKQSIIKNSFISFPTINSEITINLGKDFRFQGEGANLLLTGNITVKKIGNMPLKTSGEARTLEGSDYEIFGRKLPIENGYIIFNGPITNPAINILAIRRNQKVQAGILIRGTVFNPETKLISEPEVSDNEKLYWILFGVGSGNISKINTALNAISLLGNIKIKQVAQNIGLDRLTLGPSESGLPDLQVISIAKIIKDNFTLSYERSLTTAASLFKINWLFSRYWSFSAQIGAINGISVYYSRRFDSL